MSRDHLGQNTHLPDGFADYRSIRRALAEKTRDFVSGTDYRIQFRIGSGYVGSQINQVFGLAVERQRIANLAGVIGLLRSGETRLEPAYGIEHLDCRIVSGGPEIAGQRDMPIEDRAHGIADGFVEIVAFDQDGKECGNGAVLEVPGALTDFGSRLKTDRVYPFWLGGSPAASPISLWAMARRVIESITNSTSSPRSRKYSAMARATKQARTRRGAGRSDVAATTTRAPHPLCAQVVLDERPDFTVPLADEGDDVDRGGTGPRHRAEQCAFTDAAAAENTDALTLSTGQQTIDYADSGGQRLVDMGSFHRAQRLGMEGPGLGRRGLVCRLANARS